MKVAIHQPNFLPWAGYFYKLLRADIFIFFDTVQFPRGKSYCSRVKIKSPQGARWLTVPVKGKGNFLPIKDVQVAGYDWVKKHLGTFKAYYSQAPYWGTFSPGIENIYRDTWRYISDFNIALIKFIAAAIQADTKFIRSSDVDLECSDTGEYIINLVKAVGGTVYITGQGAGTMRYMDEQKFNQAGINVEQTNYEELTYDQLYGHFVPGLSVVDILFNTGIEARDIILSGNN